MPTAELLEIDTPSWAPRAPLTAARSEATATLLKNGKVLVAGGVGRDTAVLHDPAANTWAPTGNNMARPRSRHAMVTLVNGQVLVVGGQEDPTGSADIYDPPTDQWAGAGSLGSGRWNLTATLLPCGEVLEAGGEVSSGVAVTSAARFNPRSGQWVPTGVMGVPRTRHTATLLKDGRVLVTGGFDGTGAVATAETYDPATGTWSPTAGTMSIARRDHTATLLPSGKVLVTGGFGGGTSADVFDPATGVFTPTGSSTFVRDTGSTVTLLPNGRVLAVGGWNSLRKAEVYDPAVGIWTALPQTAVERNEHVAILLPDGRVLVAGGGLETSVEVYDVGRGEIPAWRPATATWTDPLVTPAPFTVTGSGFQGLGEGSTGVGWMQSATNYPLVQVRRLENELMTWLPVDPGAGWSGTSFRSLPVSGIAPGLAAVTVFTSGIPSVSKMVAIECPPPTVTGSPASQSVCQGDTASFTVSASGDCPTFQWSREGAPILEGGRFTGTRTTTLAITNVQPSDAGAFKATVALACSSTVVDSASATLSVTAALSGVTAALSGPATVCSTCLGGAASESHVAGGSVARQWGYRTTSGGTITDIPGATAASYVLNGTDFPGAGGYFLVVRVTPACGPLQVSNELAVTVDDSPPPGDEVRFFTVTSRNAENVLEWINPPAGGTVSIRFNGSSTSCAFPATETDGAPVPGGTFVATGDARERLAHASLVNTSFYCYSIFYDSGGGWKGPRTNSGRPFDTSGNVKWAFSSGLFSTTPPTVGGAGVIATNNDNVVHAMERGALGGEWPAGWRPALLGGAVQGRSPVVPIPVGGANPVVFLGAQDGGVYAVNGATGGAGPAPWAAPTAIGGIVQAAPGGMFTAFGGARDALFVGTRDAGADNALVALDPDGTEVDRFDNGGGANSIGVISGAATVDYARRRVYFASDVGGSANTLWCLEIDDVLANPVFKQLLWARSLGRITSSPVIRGDRVYVANDLGTLYSVHESGAAGLDRTLTIETGGVKGFVFPDRSSQDLYFSTSGQVRVETDGPVLIAPKCSFGGGGLAPSPVLYVAALGRVYFGGSDGKLYELEAATCGAPKSVVLGDGTATVGAPSFDLVNGLVHVGTASGVFYAVQVPLP